MPTENKSFDKALDAALLEDDADLLPKKEKETLKAAKKLGVKKPPPPDLGDEVNQEYYASGR